MKSLHKNKKGGGFAVVLVIIVIVCAVLILPSVVSGEGFSFGGIFDEIANFIGSLIGGGSNDGFVGVGFTVYFKDGSTKDYGATPDFNISPLSISVENKEVDEMDIIVRGRFTADDVGQWNAEITQQIELYKKPSLTPLFSSTGTFQKAGYTWEPNTTKDLATYTLDADVLNDLVEDYGAGSWFLQVNVEIDLEIDVNGVMETYTGLAPSGGIDFVYENGSNTPVEMSITTQPTSIPRRHHTKDNN